VWSDEVQHPKAVRFAWKNVPHPNLFNGAGLPASPFRTDSWKLTTEGKN
jgi:sialate O-acetylesterase